MYKVYCTDLEELIVEEVVVDSPSFLTDLVWEFVDGDGVNTVICFSNDKNAAMNSVEHYIKRLKDEKDNICNSTFTIATNSEE